jgi:hypothetical protein
MTTTPPSGPRPRSRRIRIHVDGETLDATVHDNPAADSLLDQLPVTVQLSDYAGQEKTAPLAKPLTMTGMPAGDRARPLDLGYYAPDGVLVLYYTDVPYYRGIALLGRVHATTDDLRDIRDGAVATLDLAADAGG